MKPALATLALAAAVALPPGQPAGAAGSPEPPEDAVIAALPFAPESPRNRVMVDLAPEGGRPWVMMLDTGAAQSVVTPRMARELGVSVRRTKSSPYRKKTRLGRDLQFRIDTRSSDMGSKTGFEYGLLGGDFLDDYILEIDFPRRLVRFLDPKKYRIPKSVEAADERVVRVRIGGTRVLTEIELHGKSLRALLDTGAPHSVLLSGKAAKKAGIDVDGLVDFGEVGTVMGPTEVRFHETDTFSFAGFAFDAMPVIVAPRGFYNMAGPTDSIVGYDVMSQFVMRIDYAGARLWLKRSGDTRVTFLGSDYTGSQELGAFVTETQPGQFQVWWVAPEGPARRYGLRQNDVVLARGDERLTQEEILRRVREGERLKVARQQGEVWREIETPPAGFVAGPSDE